MTARNDPCHCGSERKYKHCHLRLDEAVGADRYDASQEIYSTNWKTTAAAHDEDGLYDWLADRLSSLNPKRILDVGSGSGHGLAALERAFGPDLTLVGIDENPHCLRESRATLNRAGLPPTLYQERLTISESGGIYAHQAAAAPEIPPTGVTLIQSDVCNDPDLVEALITSGPFDAVTVWLTGVHMLRQQHVDVIAHGVDSDGVHRLFVQNSVYELADRVLRPGGILQVADRGEAPTSDLLRADILSAHAEQASVTSLEIQDVQWRPYQAPVGRRVPLGETRGLSGRAGSGVWAVTSVTSVKS